MNTFSTANTVIPFPKCNQGRVRKSGCIGARGIMSLGFFDIAAPENVVPLDDHRDEEVFVDDTNALLAIALFATATAEQKAHVQTQIEYMRKARPKSRDRAVAARLSQMLSGR